MASSKGTNGVQLDGNVTSNVNECKQTPELAEKADSDKTGSEILDEHQSNFPVLQETSLITGNNENSLDDFVPTQSKRRKIHVSADQCQTFADSPEYGGKVLTHPAGSLIPSKDINLQHLVPSQYSRKKPCAALGKSPDLGSQIKQKRNEESESKNGSFQHGLVSSFKAGLMGGFTSAAKLHNESPDLSSHFEIKSFSQPPYAQSNKRKTNVQTDSKQKSITRFFGGSASTSSQSIVQSSAKVPANMARSSPIVISDSPISTPEKYEQIDYGSPVKMFSPIKKLEGSRNIYVNDDSPSSSQHSLSSQKSANDNTAVKQLFEGQKQYQSNKLNQAKAKAKRSKSNKSNSKSSGKGRLQTIKKETSRLSSGNISSEDDDILCTAVDLASEKFGLLGDSSTAIERPQINYFDDLPDELLEIIFAQLPMLDLCLNSNRVCTRWSQIISSDRFVPWKKKYHRLKKGSPVVQNELYCILAESSMRRSADYLIGMIRFMKTFKPITAMNMIQCLKNHKKYEWAKNLMEERITDCLLHGEPNPWSCIATLVVISQDVYDIQEIIHCLLVPMSQCTSIEVLESLYCIASLLYTFKLAKSDDVWNGMHYRVFYALYLYENASSTSLGDLNSAVTNKAGQQSLMKYSRSDTSVRMTHEQSRIVSYNVEPGEIIKIVAFAGTGKTTTLVRYTQMRPSMRFLLVVYNKSVSDYAKTQFPANVLCKTGHSLAFQWTGRRYAAKTFYNNKVKKLRNLKVYEITQALDTRKGDNLYTRAKFVMDTVNTFIASADPCITIDHVPEKRLDDNNRLIFVDPDKKSLYVRDAQQIWSKMLDLENKQVGMTHDGYLKVFQLSKPTLDDFDCILIDEAQDMSPALADILLSQPQAKVLVGDPHQQIYAFRGAVNAMSRVNATTIFYLTQSFRFGPEIAQIASSCLETLKEVKMKTLVGNGKKCQVTGETVGQVAIICRSNFTVFNEAVKKCCFGDGDVKVGFVGGTDGFGFPVLRDIYTLMMAPEQREKEGRVINDNLIKKFDNIGELEKYATRTQDNELMGKIRIVRTHHHNLLSHINKILSKCVKDLKMADFILSTAHKAKGLEFSTVKVTDDYGVNPILQMLFRHVPEIVQAMPPNAREVNMDEGNLLYVAVTRAKNALLMSPTLKTILLLCGERFEHPVCSKVLQQKGVTVKCTETDQEFKPYTLSLQRDTVKLSDDTKHDGGVISPDIITDQRKSLSHLYGLLEKDKKERPPKPQQNRPNFGQHDAFEDYDVDYPFLM